MKMVSAILAHLARATDVTDRDVTSHLELHQDATYPLIGIPEPLTFPTPGSGQIVRSSFLVEDFRTITAGAGIQIDLAFLGRGLWRFFVTMMYSSNYQDLAGVTGVELQFLRNVVKQASFIKLHSEITIQTVTKQFDLLLIDDLGAIALVLNTNIATQTHSVSTSLLGLKYL